MAFKNNSQKIKYIDRGRQILRPPLSVIVSVYGPKREFPIEACLRSLMKQKSPLPEVIVSEEYTSIPIYKTITSNFDIVYRGRILPAERSRWSPGAVRNLGALISTGSMILFLDCDMLCSEFDTIAIITRLLSENTCGFIWGPKIDRILEDAQPILMRCLNKNLDTPISTLLHENLEKAGNGFWAYPGRKLKTTSRIYHGNEYAALTEDALRFYKSPENFDGREAQVWKPRRHVGTIALHRELFIRVGGFCEQFVGWGWEDVDLIRKLEGLGKRIQSNEIDGILTHMEHSHAYLLPTESIANKEIARKRKRDGIWPSIIEDRIVLEQFDNGL